MDNTIKIKRKWLIHYNKFLCSLFGHKWDKKWKGGQDICGRCPYIGYQWE